jgi:hypothetical protein
MLSVLGVQVTNDNCSGFAVNITTVVEYTPNVNSRTGHDYSYLQQRYGSS